MNQPAKAQEPSMEEILASIRRIIADDDTTKPAPKPAPVAAAPRPAAMPPRTPVPPSEPPPAAHFEPLPPEPEEDILDLTEQMAETAEEPPSFQTIDGQSDVIFADPQPEPAPPPPRQTYAPPPQPSAAEHLISAST